MRRREFVLSATTVMAAANLGMPLLRPAFGETSADSKAANEQGAPKRFGFDDVVAMAHDLAAKPYEYHNAKLVGSFAGLNYDQYRAIRFRRESDPWAHGRNFNLDLLAPGTIFHEPVDINLVEDGVAIPVKFDPHMFDFDPAQFPDGVDHNTLGDMGWSGFRLRTPLNSPDVMDEFVTFQGASYFRAVARGTLYGLSARGLAIGTGSATGEEFPLFRSFWLHRPGVDDRSVLVHALLDSRSVSGAYEFIITPGADTVFETRVALFPRTKLDNVGIAPLTSMFWFGEIDREHVDDYRPAVHDSNGLQMVTGSKQRLWRALSSHPTLQISTFEDQDPIAFGLAQRARSFEDYKDAEAHYELRPSAWVAPQDNWGKGGVTLIEIPVENEFNDNIVTFWQPGGPLKADERYDFSYVLTFTAKEPDSAQLARVTNSMSGRAIGNEAARVYVIDFDLEPFGAVTPTAQISVSAGSIGNNYVLRLTDEGRMRLSFEFIPDGDEVADLSAVLNGPDGPLSESWIARWAP